MECLKTRWTRLTEPASMSNLLKKVEQLRRTHTLAHNAFRRSMQYPGYETGRRAHERFEVYETRFQELCDELARAVAEGQVLIGDSGRRRASGRQRCWNGSFPGNSRLCLPRVMSACTRRGDMSRCGRKARSAADTPTRREVCRSCGSA